MQVNEFESKKGAAMDQEDFAWIDYRQRFSEIYDESNYSSPLQSRVMRASHRLMERSIGPDVSFERVLEVGAGTGEHISYVRHGFNEYTLSDLDPATLEVAKRKLHGRLEGSVKYDVQPASGLTYADNTFDRLIASHVLEHICQPHLAIKEWRRVVKDGGMLSILIPTDPGLAWRLGRMLGPRRTALAQGIAYDYVMAREHVNSCVNLLALLRHYFPDCREAWWPLPLKIVDANLFCAITAIVRK